MGKEMTKIWGIDLGTTYSCIAYVDEHGKPVVVKNNEGDLITPSVVCFDNNNVTVGKVAKASAVLYHDAVVSFVKREMGNPNYLFPYDGKTYRAETISSFILKKLVADAEQQTGEKITEVVITCPAYFGDNEKAATKKAGELAGLKVHSILAEPTAAAIAWGKARTDEQVVLVYDLGGGTFDITMINVSPAAIEVIVTGGDHNLGGKDWDDTLIDYFITQYHQQTGETDALREDAETYSVLVDLAESSKKLLTAKEKAPVTFVSPSGKRVKIELTREKFEELTASLLERTVQLTHDMLQEAKKKGHTTFSEILLVGGSTRMPQVTERLQKEFDVSISSFDPDEAVAKGAALFGHGMALSKQVEEVYKGLNGGKPNDGEHTDQRLIDEAKRLVAEKEGMTIEGLSVSTKKIINVISKSFGVKTRSKNDGKIYVSNLIFKNTSVPTKVTEKFGTYEADQTSIQVLILENESSDDCFLYEPRKVTELGEATLGLPPNLPQGSPIIITFNLTEDGRLDLEAVEGTRGEKINITIQTNSVIQGEEYEKARKQSNELQVS